MTGTEIKTLKDLVDFGIAKIIFDSDNYYLYPDDPNAGIYANTIYILSRKTKEFKWASSIDYITELYDARNNEITLDELEKELNRV